MMTAADTAMPTPVSVFTTHEPFHRFRDAIADGDQPRAAIPGKRPVHAGLQLATAEKQEDEIAKHDDDQLGHVEAVREDVFQHVLRRHSEEIGNRGATANVAGLWRGRQDGLVAPFGVRR